MNNRMTIEYSADKELNNRIIAAVLNVLDQEDAALVNVEFTAATCCPLQLPTFMNRRCV